MGGCQLDFIVSLALYHWALGLKLDNFLISALEIEFLKYPKMPGNNCRVVKRVKIYLRIGAMTASEVLTFFVGTLPDIKFMSH